MASRFNPPGLWQPFGAFAMGAVPGAGHVVHLKGQVSLDAEGRVFGEDDMAAQVGQVLRNIRAVLAHVGGEMGDLFSLTQYVTDIEAFMRVGEVRKRFFKPPFPVTTTVQIARLYDARLMVEISGIAEIPAARFRPPAA